MLGFRGQQPLLQVTEPMPRPDDQGEFLRLLLSHERRIYGYIRTVVFNAVDAEDVLQETSTKLWKNFHQFRPGTDFLAWSLTVARHEVSAYRRRQRSDRLRFSDELVGLLATVAENQCAGMSTLETALAHCLGLLKPTSRDLLRRRYEPGASVERLAAETGRPVQTLYSILKRTRRAVFACIDRTLAREEHP
jgi:RNA polymerase sigma-70 factor, ECF subfamily